jgi:restriction endonuclease S subunit
MDHIDDTRNGTGMSASSTASSGADKTRRDILDDTLKVLTNKHLRQFKRYPAYKDPGIESMGEIPTHWEVSKASWLFSIGSGTTPNSDEPIYYGGDIPWITTSELRESIINGTEKTLTRNALKTYPSLRIHPKGSVAVAMYGATIGRIGMLGLPATVNQACCVFSSRQRVDGQFWFYWLQMRRPYLISLGYGGGQPNLSQDLLRSIRVPVPPANEQRDVAAFLDRETVKIDALVAKKERLIGLLQEERMALINRAVNEGLVHAVRPKRTDSPVFPVIPIHWELRKLRRILTQVRRPITLQPETEYREIGIRSWGKGIFHKDAVKGALLEEKSVFRIEPGDFILNIVFAWEGAVAVATAEEQGMIASHRFPTFRCADDVDLDFLLMVLQTEQGRAIMEVNSPGAAGRNKTIRLDQFLDELIPIPSITEQQAIISRFRAEEKRLTSFEAKIRDGKERTKELRTALIHAAVTGKIDVRQEVV